MTSEYKPSQEDKTFSQIQEELDQMTPETTPSGVSPESMIRSTSIQPLLTTISPGHKARVVLQLIRQFAREDSQEVPVSVALIVVLLGNLGSTYVSGELDRFSSSVLDFLNRVRRNALDGRIHKVNIEGETEWNLAMDPVRTNTLAAAGHIAALTARVLLLRSSYDGVKDTLVDSINRGPYSQALKDRMIRWLSLVQGIRLKAGMRGLQMRGEFVLMLSYSSAMGHHSFRRRINLMYRPDVARIYYDRVRDPLLVEIAGSLVTGEVPIVYAGLVHLIRPTKRT